MTKEKIGVLFDLDGVILDTEGIYSDFWDTIDKKIPTHVENFTSIIKGSNLATILNTYFPKSLHNEIVNMLEIFQKNMQYRYFPGAIEWVRKLYDAEVPMCIVTSSDQGKMNAVYDQHPEFRGFFKDVVVGEMVTNPKPSPECFLLGAKLIDVDINNCYIFEDSINGLKSARASGAKVIALSTTNSSEMLQAEADCVIENFVDYSIDKMKSV